MFKKSLCLLIAFLLSFQSTVFPFSGVFAQEGGESAPAPESAPPSESTTTPEPAPPPIPEPVVPSTETISGSPESAPSEQNPQAGSENTAPTITSEPIIPSTATISGSPESIPEATPEISPSPPNSVSSIPEESIIGNGVEKVKGVSFQTTVRDGDSSISFVANFKEIGYIDGTIYESDETKEILSGTLEPSQISESPIISPLQITQIETIYEPRVTSGADILGTGGYFLGTGEFGTGVDSPLGTGDLGTGEETIATMTIMELDITKVIFPENLIISTTDGQEKQPTDLTIIPEEAVTQLPNRIIQEVPVDQLMRLQNTENTELEVLSGDNTTINSGDNTLTENDLSNPSESPNLQSLPGIS